MEKQITVIIDSDGVERRVNPGQIVIRLSEISTMEAFEKASVTRITISDGRSYLVDEVADFLLSTVEAKRKKRFDDFGPGDQALADFHVFRLIKTERKPESWLGRVFADFAYLLNGDRDPLPPIEATHDAQNRPIKRGWSATGQSPGSNLA